MKNIDFWGAVAIATICFYLVFKILESIPLQ